MFNSAKTLMHPIEAMNHRKSGFFPTDMGTLNIIQKYLAPSDKGVNLLDPCCGKGDALAKIKNNLYPNAQTFGIELDKERYELAKSKLDHAYYADIYDVSLGRGNFDMILLNPPYGNDMADSLCADKTERLEHKFLKRVFPAIKAKGIIVYIVPYKSIDNSRIKWLLSRFSDLTVHMAAVDTYKQIVVIGIKLGQQRSVNEKMIDEFMQKVAEAAEATLENYQYHLPGSSYHARICVNRLNALGVAEVIRSYSGQWQHFDTLFTANVRNDFKRPIHTLSQWHLALLITSGAVQGVVTNNSGNQKLFIKGAVKKQKKVSQTQTESSNGKVTTEIITKERFSAQIKAIDITPKSEEFGNIITIK